MRNYLSVICLLLPLLAQAQPFHADTIGGTTYDWQANGACYRMIVNDTEFGIHALWMSSNWKQDLQFGDRTMSYNFLPKGSSTVVFQRLKQLYEVWNLCLRPGLAPARLRRAGRQSGEPRCLCQR